MVSIIRMSRDITEFTELMTQYFTARSIRRIASRTKLQSASQFWFLYRRCLITGTLAKRVISQNQKGENNPKLDRNISRFSYGNFKNEAMQYGIDHEKDALSTFFNIFNAIHSNARLTSTGVVLYKEYPFIAGSPDGILSCDCCPESFLIECKCPYRLRDTGVSNWRILEYFDGNQVLKSSHTYTNQINLYQGILGLQKCFFVVYAKNEVIVKLINFDKVFFEFQVKNITEYYTKHYLPTVIGKRI